MLLAPHHTPFLTRKYKCSSRTIQYVMFRSLCLFTTFNKLSTAQFTLKMPTPGLLYALSAINNPSLSESDFNTWYTSHHIRDAVDSGLSDLAIRYKNTNANAKWPYLSIYRIPDVAKLADEKLTGSIPKHHDLLPEGKPWDEVLKTDIRGLELLQKFEGQVPKEGIFNLLLVSSQTPRSHSFPFMSSPSHCCESGSALTPSP